MRQLGLVALLAVGLADSVWAQTKVPETALDAASGGGQLIGEAIRCGVPTTMVMNAQNRIVDLVISLSRDKEEGRSALRLEQAIESLYETGRDRGNAPLPPCDGVRRTLKRYADGGGR